MENTTSKDRDKLRFFVFLASIVLHSVLGTCDRLRISCGFVKRKRLRGIGYNGSISGEPHCDDVGHLMIEGHCLRTRHAEKNAISNTPREHIKGSDAIVTGTPCPDCIKDLIEEGVLRITCVGEEYRRYEADGEDVIKALAKRRGVELKQLDIDYADLFQELFNCMTRKGGLLYREGYRLKVVKEPLEPEKRS